MTNKLYVLTDIDITIIISSGFTISDIVQMTVTLTKGSEVKTYTKADGDITLGEATATLKIPRTDITETGHYEIRATFTDSGGKVRGLNTNPEWLIFY